jgi:predicted tellurium resistance membrane protein TerC
MDIFLNPETWLALLTLCFFEIILGIDNIIFISIAANRLPAAQQMRARRIGLSIALIARVWFLLGITWVISFSQPLFVIPSNFLFGALSISGRDLVLGLGGLFLIGKSASEISNLDDATKKGAMRAPSKFYHTILQIILLDIVFSFDSMLTAVGIADQVVIMIVAMIVSIFIMMIFSTSISEFIKRHPSMEMLAIGFLLLVGFLLFLEGFHFIIPKGYVYFAVGFALLIEITKIRSGKIHLNQTQNTPIRITPIKSEQIEPLIELDGKFKSVNQ